MRISDWSSDVCSSDLGLRTAGIIIAVVLIAIVAIGLTQRARSNSQMRDWTDANALPVVATVQPQPLGASAALQLPGRLEAYASAPIYARTSGYLKDWKVDIGDRKSTRLNSSH